MVEEIKSAEKFGDATLNQGPAPKHTQEEHALCAFYPIVTSMHGLFVGMRCPHDVEASGAFYSEDYVRELKITAQQLIAEMDYDGEPLHRRHSETLLIEKLRELIR